MVRKKREEKYTGVDKSRFSIVHMKNTIVNNNVRINPVCCVLTTVYIMFPIPVYIHFWMILSFLIHRHQEQILKDSNPDSTTSLLYFILTHAHKCSKIVEISEKDEIKTFTLLFPFSMFLWVALLRSP